MVGALAALLGLLSAASSSAIDLPKPQRDTIGFAFNELQTMMECSGVDAPRWERELSPVRRLAASRGYPSLVAKTRAQWLAGTARGDLYCLTDAAKRIPSRKARLMRLIGALPPR